jgi:hypothetical protein
VGSTYYRKFRDESTSLRCKIVYFDLVVGRQAFQGCGLCRDHSQTSEAVSTKNETAVKRWLSEPVIQPEFSSRRIRMVPTHLRK